MVFSEKDVQCLSAGAHILGGGGGGQKSRGLKTAEDALHIGTVRMVDAADLCDGRAHPLGTMGALGLAADPLYQTMQAACGGRSEDGTYIEVFSFGAVAATSQASRMAAGIAGGLATVVRNPVPASYLRSHAASAVIRRLSNWAAQSSLPRPPPREKQPRRHNILAGAWFVPGPSPNMSLPRLWALTMGTARFQPKPESTSCPFSTSL